MTLRELLEYRQKLLRIQLTDHSDKLMSELVSAITDINSLSDYKTSENDALKVFDRTLRDMVDTFDNFDYLRDNTVQQVDLLIDILARPYYQTKLVNAQGLKNSPIATYYDRIPKLSSKDYNLALSRLSMYNSWDSPTMQFMPGDCEFTNHLVSNDPLYLIDIDNKFFGQAKEQYTTQYQGRLRYYEIDEINSESILGKLPKGQFGFCFAWGFFNYRNIHLIRRYLAELYDYLKPGGVLFFTYNNCENLNNFDLAESDYASFILKKDLIASLNNLNYEILNIVDSDSNISWIEVKKPGELTSNRAGQTLASIINVKENK